MPPLLQEYFNYGTVENSYFFMGVGVEFVLVYIVLLLVLGKKQDRWWSVSERSALLFSAACLVISLIAFVVLGQFMAPGESSRILKTFIAKLELRKVFWFIYDSLIMNNLL